MKRWNWLIAAGLITFAAATEAQAFDQTQYQAVKNGDKACPWCNLSAANLANANLAGADLTGADLTGADLTKVDLTGADLTGAVLAGAVLLGRQFPGRGPRSS